MMKTTTTRNNNNNKTKQKRSLESKLFIYHLFSGIMRKKRERERERENKNIVLVSSGVNIVISNIIDSN